MKVSEAVLQMTKSYLHRVIEGRFVVPKEIVGSIKTSLGIELSREAYEKLLEVLTKEQLCTILEAENLPKSGRKDELQSRVLQAGIKPSQALEVLSSQDLYDICSALPSAKVSGTKADRIGRFIDYFANLIVRDVSEEASPGERYYQYLVGLAARDRQNLLTNRVIRKEPGDGERFRGRHPVSLTETLGLELESMPGSDHCDGCLRFGRNGDLFMWDKQEQGVHLQLSHHPPEAVQALHPGRPRAGLLLPGDRAGDRGGRRAERGPAEVESGADTDVALITAEDWVWVAVRWAESGDGVSFNLDVLNITGVLSRPVLEQRMKLFGRG